MPASVLKVREKTCQPRKNRSASTARKRARKCAPRCATRNPENTRSRAASRRSQLGSRRRAKKGQRFQRKNKKGEEICQPSHVHREASPPAAGKGHLHPAGRTGSLP